jgi:hypothetical protein
MASNWLYSSNGQQHGPISAAKLKQLAVDGGIGLDDLVCQEGSSNWVPAKQVKGLFSQPTSDETKGPSSPPPLPPLAQPAPANDVLPQIQIKVGETLKGIGNAVQGVAGSEQVQAAGESLKNAAGQAAAGVGNFIRSDAVQTQVKAASNFWSNMPTPLKALLIGGPIAGFLMMSCCGGCLLMMGNLPNKNRNSQNRQDSAYSYSEGDGSSSFSASELDEIKSDERLSVAFDMGHLDSSKLSNYLRMKSGQGTWENDSGMPANAYFLMLIPSREWPAAAHRLRMSKPEYRFATNFVMMTQKIPPTEWNSSLRELTGEGLDDY